MREIEFRAWADYGEHGEMLQNIQNHINGSWAFGKILNGESGGVKFSVMQYTGLKDKNGVKIYEADICLVDGLGYCAVEIDPWCGTQFVDSNGQHVPLIDCVAEGDTYEVVGNIHENPELLTGQTT